MSLRLEYLVQNNTGRAVERRMKARGRVQNDNNIKCKSLG